MADNNATAAVTMTVEVKIPMRRVYDLVVTGIESGGYGSFELAKDSGKWDEDGWMLASEAGEPEAFSRIRIQDKYEDEYPKNMWLRDAALIAGLHVMAKKYPKHFSNFMEENEDAITGDVFLQCVVFGEVVYG